ncbi:MAG: hypothetical protein I8H80_01190 [Alphaproteobacteria bacterium]|nr:hypothetical protein [Alphaproteobacteria bacterium]
MDLNKSFLNAFYFFEYLLDKKFVVPSGSFDIVSIISDMSPFVFESDEFGIHRPSDVGEGEEWIEALEKIGVTNSENITSNQAFAGAIAYLEYHKKQYNFEVQDILNLLYNMHNNPVEYKDLWDKWVEIIEKSPDLSFCIKSKK